MTGRHRSGAPGWTRAVGGVVLGATLAAGAGMFGSTPPPAPHAEPAVPVTAGQVLPVRIAVPEIAPALTVYDDDPARGQRRCDVWKSLYSDEQRPACTVRPTGEGPSPARARAGQRWWIDNVPDAATEPGEPGTSSADRAPSETNEK